MKTIDFVLAGVFVLVLGIAGLAVADEPAPPAPPAPDDWASRVQQLEQVVRQQQQQIQKLSMENQSRWMQERRAAQTRELVREVLADADTRASLLQDQVNAGWNNGFFLASDDGSFLLRIKGMIQFRYTSSHTRDGYDESTNTKLDDDRGGFELTRVRYGFFGHVVDPTWRFGIWAGFHWDGSSLLLDSYIEKDLGEGWTLTAGQFKAPFLREWLISETQLQFVERSLISGCFCGNYVQGVKLGYRNEDLALMFSVGDGLTSLNSRWDREDTEGLALTGRAEWKVMGDWKNASDLQGWPEQERLLILGGAIHWQQGEYGTSGTTLTTGDEAEDLRWTVDMQYEGPGYNVYAAVIGNHQSDADYIHDLGQIAVLVQGGVFILSDLELIGRYEWGDNDVEDTDELSILTVGVNKYFSRHQVRWTTDVGYAFGALNRRSISGNTLGFPNEFMGWRPDREDGQVLVRTQLQLLF